MKKLDDSSSQISSLLLISRTRKNNISSSVENLNGYLQKRNLENLSLSEKFKYNSIGNNLNPWGHRETISDLNKNLLSRARKTHPNSDIEKVTQKFYLSEIYLDAQTQSKVKPILNNAVAGKSKAKAQRVTDTLTSTSLSTSTGNKKSLNRKKKLSFLDAFSIYKKKGLPKRISNSTRLSIANQVKIKENKTVTNNIIQPYTNINKDNSKELIEQKEVFNIYPSSSDQVRNKFNLLTLGSQLNLNKNSKLKLDSHLINYLTNIAVAGKLTSGLTSEKIYSFTPSLSMPLPIRKTKKSIPLTYNYFNSKYIADIPKDKGKWRYLDKNLINNSSSDIGQYHDKNILDSSLTPKLSLTGSTRLRKLKMLKLKNLSRFNHSIKKNKSGAGARRFNQTNKKYFYYIFKNPTKDKNKKRLKRLTKINLNNSFPDNVPFSIQTPVEGENFYSGSGNGATRFSTSKPGITSNFQVNGKKLNILKNLNYFNLLNKVSNMKSFKNNSILVSSLTPKLISNYIFKIQNKKNIIAFKNLIRRESMNLQVNSVNQAYTPLFNYFDIINLTSRIERHRILNNISYSPKDNLEANRLKELNLTKRERNKEQGLLSISTPFFNVLSGLSLIRNINKSLNYYRLKKNNIIGSFILFNLISQVNSVNQAYGITSLANDNQEANPEKKTKNINMRDKQKIKNNYLNLFLLIEKLNFLLKLIKKLEVVITLLSSNVFFSNRRYLVKNGQSQVTRLALANQEENQPKYGNDNIFAHMLDYLNNLKNNITENLINFEKEKLNLLNNLAKDLNNFSKVNRINATEQSEQVNFFDLLNKLNFNSIYKHTAYASKTIYKTLIKNKTLKYNRKTLIINSKFKLLKLFKLSRFNALAFKNLYHLGIIKEELEHSKVTSANLDTRLNPDTRQIPDSLTNLTHNQVRSTLENQYLSYLKFFKDATGVGSRKSNRFIFKNFQKISSVRFAINSCKGLLAVGLNRLNNNTTAPDSLNNKRFVAKTRLANQYKKSNLSVLMSRTSYFNLLNSSFNYEDKERLGLVSFANLDEKNLTTSETKLANQDLQVNSVNQAYAREYENNFNFPIQIPILRGTRLALANQVKFKKTEHSVSTNTTTTPLPNENNSGAGRLAELTKINTTAKELFHPNNENISNLSILIMLNLIPLDKQSKILSHCGVSGVNLSNSNLNLFKNIDLYNEHINNNLKFVFSIIRSLNKIKANYRNEKLNKFISLSEPVLERKTVNINANYRRLRVENYLSSHNEKNKIKGLNNHLNLFVKAPKNYTLNLELSSYARNNSCTDKLGVYTGLTKLTYKITGDTNQTIKSITNNSDNKINLIFSHWMSRYILDLKTNIENNFFIKLLELFKSKNLIFKIKNYSKLFFSGQVNPAYKSKSDFSRLHANKTSLISPSLLRGSDKNKGDQDQFTYLNTQKVNQLKGHYKLTELTLNPIAQGPVINSVDDTNLFDSSLTPIKNDQDKFKESNEAVALNKISIKEIYLPKLKGYNSKEKKIMISPLELKKFWFSVKNFKNKLKNLTRTRDNQATVSSQLFISRSTNKPNSLFNKNSMGTYTRKNILFNHLRTRGLELNNQIKPGADRLAKLTKRRLILKLDFLRSSDLIKYIEDDLLIDIKGRNAYFYPELKIKGTFEFFIRVYKEKLLNKKGKINIFKLNSPILQGIVVKNALEYFLINKTPFPIYYIKNFLLPEYLYKFKTMYSEMINSGRSDVKIKQILNKEYKKKIARNMVYAKNLLKLEENSNNLIALNRTSIDNNNNLEYESKNNINKLALLTKPSILKIEKAIMNIIENKFIETTPSLLNLIKKESESKNSLINKKLLSKLEYLIQSPDSASDIPNININKEERYLLSPEDKKGNKIYMLYKEKLFYNKSKIYTLADLIKFALKKSSFNQGEIDQDKNGAIARKTITSFEQINKDIIARSLLKKMSEGLNIFNTAGFTKKDNYSLVQGTGLENLAYEPNRIGTVAYAPKLIFTNKKSKKTVYELGLRRYLYKYNYILNTGKYQSIAFNFLNKFKRINTFNSIDQTGSLVLFNVSVLLKYFFKLIGGALISKPVFEFKHNKVVIKLFFFIKKNIIFFNDNHATSSIHDNMINFFLDSSLTKYAPILRNISNDLNLITVAQDNKDWNFSRSLVKNKILRGSVNNLKLRTEMLNDTKVAVENSSNLAYAPHLMNKGEIDEFSLNNILKQNLLTLNNKVSKLYRNYNVLNNKTYSGKYKILKKRTYRKLLKLVKYNFFNKEIKNNLSLSKRNLNSLDMNYYNKARDIFSIKELSRFNRGKAKNSNALNLALVSKFKGNYYKYFKENFIYFNVLDTFKKEFNALTLILEKFFNSYVQLEITRIYYPFFDSNILAQIIAINGKFYNFERIIKLLLPKLKIRNPHTFFKDLDFSPKSKNSIASYLSGLDIKVAGRFYKHKIIPRKTVSKIHKGSLARDFVNFVDSSRFTNKSKRGSFSITVSISHVY